MHTQARTHTHTHTHGHTQRQTTGLHGVSNYKRAHHQAEHDAVPKPPQNTIWPHQTMPFMRLQSLKLASPLDCRHIAPRHVHTYMCESTYLLGHFDGIKGMKRCTDKLLLFISSGQLPPHPSPHIVRQFHVRWWCHHRRQTIGVGREIMVCMHARVHVTRQRVTWPWLKQLFDIDWPLLHMYKH